MSDESFEEEDVVKDFPELFPDTVERITLEPPAVQLKTMQMFSTISGGLRAGELSLFCGGTGIGKTTWLANLSRDLFLQGIPHLVASVETGPHDFQRRVISAQLGVDVDGPTAIDRVERFTNENYGLLSQKNVLRLALYEDRVSVERILHVIRREHEMHKTKVVILDNLNFFLEVKKFDDAIVEMDRVIHSMVMFVKTCPVHIVLVMHPKKLDGARVRSEMDIKGSSTAVQEAHNVWLFNRPEENDIKENRMDPFDREFMVAKCRRKGMATMKRFRIQSVNGVQYKEYGEL